MKRIISLLFLLSLCLSLCACARQDAVTYYYVRREQDYVYGSAEGVIVGESREAAGHVDDLRYLLILYFHGPVSENLKSPFPSGTVIEAIDREEEHLDIRLSGIVSLMNGTDLTLACACLAQTCFGLTDVQTVTIHAQGFGSVSVTLDRDSLLLTDTGARDLYQESE